MITVLAWLAVVVLILVVAVGVVTLIAARSDRHRTQRGKPPYTPRHGKRPV